MLPKQLSMIKKHNAFREETPLEFLMRIMQDDNVILGLRMEAAKALLPYTHRKLPAEVKIETGNIDVIQPYIPTKRELRDTFIRKPDDEIEDL